MFIVSLTYKKPITEIEKHIAEHDALLEKLDSQKTLIFSARKNPRTGGVIVLYNLTKVEVENIIKLDPFHKNEIADYEITEVIPRKYAKGFEVFLENNA